jgi:broad specificity phosphatase PhoE
VSLRLLALLVLLLGVGCPEQPKSAAGAGTTLLLVRHGESWKNVPPPPNLSGDQLDALTPRGLEQIAAVASALRSRGATAIFTSPLGRTRETAALLAAALGSKPEIVEALVTLKPGEAPDRAIAFVRSLEGRGTVVLVTHGDIIAAVLGEAAGTPAAERAKKHDVPTGSWSEVSLGDKGTLRLVRQATAP